MFEVLGVQVNLLAIGLAAVVNIVIGMLWYSDLLFGKLWKRLTANTNTQMKGFDMILMVVLALLIATGLNSVLQFSSRVTGLYGLWNIVLTVFMVVTTFVLPTLYNSVIFEGKSRKLFFLNISHHYVEYFLMACVIALIV